MQNEQEIAMFTLTTFWNRFVLFSGGQYRKQLSQGALKNVYLLDTVSGQWLNYENQPQMTTGRSHHSSCSTRDKIFLFGGMEQTNPQKDINSIEMAEVTFQQGDLDKPIIC